ncbi:hypothetical protein D3C81_1973790 [compost metagenome]
MAALARSLIGSLPAVGVAKSGLKRAKRLRKSKSISNCWFLSVSTATSNSFSVSVGFCGTHGENEMTLILLLVRSNSYRRIRPLPPMYAIW